MKPDCAAARSKTQFAELKRITKTRERVWLDSPTDGTYRVTTMGGGRTTLIEGDAAKVKAFLQTLPVRIGGH